MKKTNILLIAACLLLLTACGKASTETATTAEATAAETTRAETVAETTAAEPVTETTTTPTEKTVPEIAVAETVTETTEETTEETTAEPVPEDLWGRTVIRNGERWRYNSRLTTVLLLGVDTAQPEEEGVSDFGSNGHADAIVLLVIDPDTQTVQPILMSRDTIAQVDVYTEDREFMFSGDMQIAMQYSVGDSHARSCYLMKKAVSRVLLELPIDSCCSVTLDGIAAAVEHLGGIQLTIPEDWTDLNPDYTAGAVVTLDAAATERLLRYRDLEAAGSNETRMERIGWFLTQMVGSLSAGELQELAEVLEPFSESDLSAETMQQLTSYPFRQELLRIPGETIPDADAIFEEFHVDEARLKDLLLQVFYRKADET